MDAVLIVMHALYMYAEAHLGLSVAFGTDERWALGQDRGYAEWFGYAKLSAIIGLLIWVHRRRSGPAYAGWALTFAVILADDALMIHEQLGEALASLVGMSAAFGLRPQDFGELSIWAVMGATVLLVLFFAHRASDARAQHHSRLLFLLLLALIFCAVVMDMLQITVADSGWVSAAARIADDGGELLVLSAITAHVTSIASALRVGDDATTRHL